MENAAAVTGLLCPLRDLSENLRSATLQIAGTRGAGQVRRYLRLGLIARQGI